MPAFKLLTAFVLAAAVCPAARADDPARFYVVLFGGQAGTLRPQTAHTWATFVRAAPLANGTVTLESFTISWLPEDMRVRPFRLRPQVGHNFTLHETLDHLNGRRSDLSVWGPFEISGGWHADALRHKQGLDAGAVRYRVFDRGDRRPDLSHCVHAVTYTHPGLRAAANPVTWYGELITRKVANAMAESGAVPDPATTHDWLLPALGLDGYALTRRRVGEPVLKFLREKVPVPIVRKP